MTEIEFYYLMTCVGAFFVFAISLAYITWSWERSCGGAITSDRPTSDRASNVNSHTKLAA